MRPILIVILASVFNRLPRASEGEKPILVQALQSQSTIEAFNESVVCGRDPPIGPVKPEDVYPMTPYANAPATGWRDGDTESLGVAIDSMTTLKGQAIALLKKQIPRPEGGIYGPQFRKIIS